MGAMTTVNIFEAKASFSNWSLLPKQVRPWSSRGTESPWRILGPIDPVAFPPARLGDLAGQFTVPDDFDEWSDEDDALWYGSGQDSRRP